MINVKIKRKVFKTFCILISFLCLLNFSGCKREEIVASTDKIEISLDDINQNIRLAKFEYRSIFGDNNWNDIASTSKNKTEDFRKSAINYLVLSSYKDEENRKNKNNYTERQLKEAVEDAIDEIDNNKHSKSEYEKLNIDEKILEQYIKNKLIESKHQENFYKRIKVSKDDKKKYYENNINKYKEIEFDCYQIWIKDLKNKNKIEKAYKELKSGKEFGFVAKKYSEDQRNNKTNGYIGKSKKENLLPELRDEVLELENDEYTAPIKTKDGYFIIKVKNKNTIINPFDKCESNIESEILEHMYQENDRKMLQKINVKYNEDNIKKIDILLDKK